MSMTDGVATMDKTEAAMQAAGVSNEEPQYTDYFGFTSTERYYLPDGKQWIEFQRMNEGKKREFQKLTSRDLRVQRTTGDALMKVDPGLERQELIKLSMVGWNLMQPDPKNSGEWRAAPYDSSNIRRFLEGANPEIIDGLEKAIRKANPWMMDEMSVEEIDKEIENLQEMRKVAEEREAKKNDSAA